MEAEIVNYLKRHRFSYIKLDSNDIKDVYDGFFNEVFKDEASGMVKNYYGIYYQSINVFDKMKKYYLEAADLGNKNSMNNMGFYYQSTGNFEDMKKYYLMAIELGDPVAMGNLGYYYYTIGDYDNMIIYYTMAITINPIPGLVLMGDYYKKIKDYDNMIKNYLEAIEAGSNVAMNNLGNYYESIGDDVNTKKYYLMAIDAGNVTSIRNLGYYYYTIGDYDNMIKYYLMEVEQGSMESIEEMLIYNKNHQEFKINFILALFQHHRNIFDKQEYVGAILFVIEEHINKKDINDKLLEIIAYVDIKYFINCSKLLLLTKKLLNEKINLIDLHFHYSPDGKGCQEAKADFLERLT